MIYGYLRVSSDMQDVNSQKQGVDEFAKSHGWKIEKYISDEGVSGGKNPDKRKLGPLLKALKKDDIIICSEISRLGRDIYMVMDILHFCMEKGCIIYTVKDRFVLGDDLQSKVLAFAFGLAAEIERQMIRQRTKEGIALKRKLGVLMGRPCGKKSSKYKLDKYNDDIKHCLAIGFGYTTIARKLKVDRNTIAKHINRRDLRENKIIWAENMAKSDRKRARIRSRLLSFGRLNGENIRIIDLSEDERDKMRELIFQDLTIPMISEHFKEYEYDELYDTIQFDGEFNTLYRQHGQLKVKKKRM